MCLPACECGSFWAVKLFELLLDDVLSIVSMRIKILNVIFQSCGKRLIRPDAQDVNKMLNFETDDETDADSIFSRQTSRDDCLDAFDDEEEEGGFGGVGRNGGGANRGVARGMLDRRTFSRVKFSKDHDIHTFSCGELADGCLFVSHPAGSDLLLKSVITSLCPPLSAQFSGVFPLRSTDVGSAPPSSKARTTPLKCLLAAA